MPSLETTDFLPPVIESFTISNPAGTLSSITISFAVAVPLFVTLI